MLKLPNGKNVDEEMLKEALENAGDELSYYLNVQTGEVVVITGMEDIDEEIDPEDLDDPDMYVPINRIPSYEGYRWMEDFVSQVVEPQDRQLAGKLEVALMGKGAFRRFKDVLRTGDDKWQQAWYRWEDEQLTQAMEEWFKDLLLEEPPAGEREDEDE